MHDPSKLFLGKLPKKDDPRTLKLAKYITPDLPTPPRMQEWTSKVQGWGMYRNDELGDCAVATPCNMVRAWTANASLQSDVSVDDCVRAYSAISGYDPAKPGTDRGCYVIDVLKYWRNTGIGGHKIGGFAELNPKDRDELAVGMFLFGGLYSGALLPLTAQSQTLWDIPADGLLVGDAAPGTWGGHAMPLVVYDMDSEGVVFETWGGLQRATWDWVFAYVDELYAVFSEDFLYKGAAPNGFERGVLVFDLAALGGQIAPEAVTVAMKLSPGVSGERFADTWAVVSAVQAKALKASGVDGVIRYLDNLTVQELQWLLQAGLKVGFVSSCRGTGWIPTGALGTADGLVAVQKARALGAPVGVTLYTDMEGEGGTAQNEIDYLEARGSAIRALGFGHGIYEGWGQKLSGPGLYALHNTQYYWAALGIAEPRPTCGWSMLQLMPPNQLRCGVRVDLDVVQQDQKGRTPVFVQAA